MGFLDKFINTEAVAETTIKDPGEVVRGLLQGVSGEGHHRDIGFNIFYRVIGFKGSVPGVGCSTIVANTAMALADLGLTVCVFDTSIMHPTQDMLLKTNVNSVEEDERVDWFDMPFTEKSVLHVSSRNHHISVLSFYGKRRTVLDMFSSLDSPELVDTAVNTLQDKFDVILIDLCEELTKVNIFAMQKAQHILQVWDDSIGSLANLNNNITNSVVLSCPMDKMRYVIENKMHDDVMGDLDALYKQYRFKLLAHCPNSTEISRLGSLNQQLWQYASKDPNIMKFTQCIIDIVKHICNIKDKEDLEDEKKKKKKKVTAKDVSEGKVEGTLHAKLRQEQEQMQEIISTPHLGVEEGEEYAEENEESYTEEYEDSYEGTEEEFYEEEETDEEVYEEESEEYEEASEEEVYEEEEVDDMFAETDDLFGDDEDDLFSNSIPTRPTRQSKVPGMNRLQKGGRTE